MIEQSPHQSPHVSTISAGPRLTVRRVTGGLLVAATSAMALATLAGFGGRVWWVLDLAANFRALYAIGLLVAAVALMALRWPKQALGAAIVGVMNAALVAPYLVGASASPAPGSDLLDVVSFNVGISTSRRADVMAWIASEEPDLVFLFESSFEWEDAATRADLGLAFVAIVPRGRLAGVTVLARPELAARVIDTLFDPSEAAAVEVSHAGERLTVLGLHPPSPTDANRSDRRDAVLASAGDWVTGRSTEVLVVGDLNATPWSAGFRDLARRGHLADSLRGRGLQPSWPAGFGPLMIPIDHALHTDGLLVADRRTGPANGSAHRPLVVSIAAAG